MDEFFGLILRFFWYVISDIIFMTFCYWIGWPVCKVLSLGRYPPKRQAAYEHSNSEEGWLCSLVGFLVILALAYFLLID